MAMETHCYLQRSVETTWFSLGTHFFHFKYYKEVSHNPKIIVLINYKKKGLQLCWIFKQ